MIQKLIQKIQKTHAPIVVGLDPMLSYVPAHIQKRAFEEHGETLEGAAEAIWQYNKEIVDHVYDLIPAVKPQIAMYEQFGIEGLKAYDKTVKYCQEKGLVVIGDAKRGDIGSTSAAYATAHLGKVKVGNSICSAFNTDFLTVTPYLGTDGVNPFVDVCNAEDKGIFVLTECADSGDTLSCYKLGKLYLDGKITTQNLDKAEKYLIAADENEYAFYALGKLYLTEEKRDVQCAVSYFEKCSNMNTWASYWLGKIYLFGCEEVPQNREKALQFLTFSAERGNGYAQNILDNMEQYQSEMLTNTIFSLFVNLSRCLSEDYNQKFQSGRISVYKNLRRMMQEKKQALGMKEERTQTQEQSY